MDNGDLVHPVDKVIQFLRYNRKALPFSISLDSVDALTFWLVLVDHGDDNKSATQVKDFFTLSVQEAHNKEMRLTGATSYEVDAIEITKQMLGWMFEVEYQRPAWLTHNALAVAIDTIIRNIKIVKAQNVPDLNLNAGNISALPFFERSDKRMKQIQELIMEVQNDLIITKNYSPDDAPVVTMLLAYVDMAKQGVERALGVIAPKVTPPQ